jgi:hypothetical protein
MEKQLSRKDLMSTLELNLPNVGKGVLSVCEERLRMSRVLTKRRGMLELRHDTERAEFIESVRLELNRLRAQQFSERARQCELREHERRRTALHERLGAYEDEFEREAQVVEERLAVERLREQERQSAEGLRAAEERAMLRRRVIAHRVEVARLKEARAEEERLIGEEMRAKIRALVEAHRPHVERRSELLREKELARLAQEARLKLEDDERQAALMRLVATVRSCSLFISILD